MMARVIALMVGASYSLAVGWAFLVPQGFYSTIAPLHASGPERRAAGGADAQVPRQAASAVGAGPPRPKP
jgi:hypothetical protein